MAEDTLLERSPYYGGGIFANNVLAKNIACYLDACVSAIGIANGVFILLRYREQWIAWYIDAILEGIINILSGQFVLLILKFVFSAISFALFAIMAVEASSFGNKGCMSYSGDSVSCCFNKLSRAYILRIKVAE